MSRIEEALEKAALLREGLGTLPEEAKPEKPKSGYRTSPVYSPSPTGSVTVESPYVVTMTAPHSPIAEEYRKLKSAIVGLTKQGGFDNTIMVTSTVGCEGKSLTSLNLAVTLAQEFDHTVLLIDADLRKPSIHSYLGLKPALGLAECLTEGRDIGDALIKTGIGKLSVLPAGRHVHNPAELFSSQKMAELIEEMKHRYPDRYIIIDTPPVLPFAETHSLGRVVDGVVMVVREKTATPQDIADAIHALKGTRILGLVYNDASASGLSGRYSHYYHGYDYSATVPSRGAAEGKKGLLDRLLRR